MGLSRFDNSTGTRMYGTFTNTEGTYNISLGGGAFYIIRVRYKPQPTIELASPAVLCAGTTNTIGTNETSGSLTYKWVSPSSILTPDNQSSYSMALVTGDYSVTVANSNNAVCSGNATKHIDITALPTITGTTPGTRCDAGNVYLGATASAGDVKWYAASTGGNSLGTGITFVTPPISVTTNYFAEAIDNNCPSAARSAVTASVYATPTITSATPDSRCGTGTVTLNAAATTGTINWYNTPSGGTSLTTGTSYSPSVSATTTYYVDATDSGTVYSCTSSRTPVIATVNTTPVILIKKLLLQRVVQMAIHQGSK